MSMSSVSLDPQATETAQWPCGAVRNAACVRAGMCVCFYACVCVCVNPPPPVHECLRMCLYGCVGVHLSVVATVFTLAQSNLSRSQILSVMIYLGCCSQMLHIMLSCSLRLIVGEHLIVSDLTVRTVHEAVGVILHNTHLIGLCLSLSVSTCVFCTRRDRWLLCMTFACSRPIFLRAMFCTPITRKKGMWNMRT